MTEAANRLVVAATAERALGRLPQGVAAAMVAFMVGSLPDAPGRIGHWLQRDLAGLWTTRRGPYRAVYEIDDDQRVINVVRIDHRADIYRPR